MKKTVLISTFFLLILSVNGQWNGTDPVYTLKKVGVGTNIPDYSLQVESSSDKIVRITAKGEGWGGASLFEIYSQRNTAGNNTPLMQVGSAYSPNIFRVTNSGKVGIGVNSPYYSLDVASSGDNIMKITANGEGWGGASLFEIYSQRNTAGNNTPLMQVGSAYSPNTFRVTNSGSVGIGSNNPIYSLQVESDKDRIMRITALGKGWGGTSLFEIYSQREDEGNSVPLLMVRSAYDAIGFRVTNAGRVGIGVASPGYSLDVGGTIRACEVKVNLNNGCNGADFVFEQDYNLMSINELDQFITVNKHLPEIAPAKEMKEEGLNVSEFNIQLLQKIEELTLYTIEQQKLIDNLIEKMDKLESKE